MTESNKRAFADLRTIMRTAYDFGSTFGMDITYPVRHHRRRFSI